ncbi:MBL fold metallo-hydrolase [Thioclava sp. FR2]|uniref:MBL fold metallo-hydrolase n=1 Tax=Thioclava sp. FR2 TaxID=3445780 RepID=UPI003EBCBE2C
MLTRRHFLTASAATLALPFAPRRLWAGASATLGNMQIDTLSDGNLTLPGDFILGGMPQDEMQAIVTKYGLPTDQLTPPCNVTLLRDGINTVLFDVGAGPDFQPSAGKLMEAFDALGLTVDDVTHVLFTHAHPDHIWGLLDEFDEPMFPNAEYMIGQAEFDYWMDPETVNTIGEARTTFAVGAARRLQAIAEQVKFIADGEEVLPGVAAHLTAGHTPGHMAFELRQGSEAAMVVGDALGNHHVAFERPDWASGSDQDKEMAAATRGKLLDRLANEKMALIGYHLPGGGIGRAEKSDSGYIFVES